MESPSPQSKRELLAQTIAQAFNDTEQISLYLNYCKKYPLALVLRAYAEAKSIPPAQIKKSRAAIFFYLIKKYGHERRQNLSH